MDTKNTTEINAEELIGLDSHLENCLSKLDPKNTEHRRIAIKAMELYITKYITPAMYLPDTSIGGVIGNESLGFPFSVFFDSERQDLSRPNEEELTETLKMAVDEPTSQLRDDFWAAWLLREAVSCIMSLCNFLKEPIPPRGHKQIAVDVLKHEIKQLQQIFKLPMTNVKYDIEYLIECEQEALAEWNEEVTAS